MRWEVPNVRRVSAHGNRAPGFPHSAPFDIRATVQNQLAQKLGTRINSGARIAVAVGSRGISNLPLIVSVAVAWLKEKGALPFIIPAMGSHGGAIPEGQAGILSGYGINEETMGAPVRASLDVTQLGNTDDGTGVYCSNEALSADGILVINRVKPHTDFSGKIGSGLLKIITIGLGKRMGAATCHAAFAQLGHERVIRKVSGLIRRSARSWVESRSWKTRLMQRRMSWFCAMKRWRPRRRNCLPGPKI